MKMTYHILNGDALKDHFPKSIEGELIVARECLVDGNVEGNTLSAFFKNRAQFIAKNYPGESTDQYFLHVVPEFDKIMKIPTNSNVNLWFEDDLFCQINFWFVCHLLKQSNKLPSIYLVRPQNNLAYGFGGLDQKGLQEAYTHRIHLNEQTIQDLSKLWAAYQSNNKTKMSKLGVKMKGELPFILEAINAHLDNQPKDGKPGRIEQTLKAIVVEHQTTAFGPVFKEFCKREPIYGLGDLQVKRILEQLLRNLS